MKAHWYAVGLVLILMLVGLGADLHYTGLVRALAWVVAAHIPALLYYLWKEHGIDWT